MNEKEMNFADLQEQYCEESLIVYYSLLEIACQIRYVASTFSEEFRKEALLKLSLPPLNATTRIII